MNGPRIGIAGAWMVLALIAAPAGAGELLVRGATVHTLGARGVLEQSDVRVREGRIVEVGSALAAAGAEVIEANGRPLTPGLFGGITTLGIEEVSQETSTIDNAPHLVAAAGPGSAELRPEFDVRPAFDPDSAVIGVNRIEGLSWAMIAPSAMATGAACVTAWRIRVSSRACISSTTRHSCSGCTGPAPRSAVRCSSAA
jgi:dihydroorotase-like cyclic amidohydrolase